MRWTNEQISRLRLLAEQGVPNKEIAGRLNIDVKDVYAKRSQLGITIDKVRAAAENKAETPKLNTVHDEKKRFVQSLWKALLLYFIEIESMTYEVSFGNEYVTLAYINGAKKRICVTADSLPALLRDVAEYL